VEVIILAWKPVAVESTAPGVFAWSPGHRPVPWAEERNEALAVQPSLPEAIHLKISETYMSA